MVFFQIRQLKGLWIAWSNILESFVKLISKNSISGLPLTSLSFFAARTPQPSSSGYSASTWRRWRPGWAASCGRRPTGRRRPPWPTRSWIWAWNRAWDQEAGGRIRIWMILRWSRWQRWRSPRVAPPLSTPASGECCAQRWGKNSVSDLDSGRPKLSPLHPKKREKWRNLIFGVWRLLLKPECLLYPLRGGRGWRRQLWRFLIPKIFSLS